MRKALLFGIAGSFSLLWICFMIAANTATTQAATITAASCSQTDVQSALNSAADGSTVMLPACSSASWGTVTIPSTKNLTLDGNGTTISGGISIGSSPTYHARVTNFSFTSTGAISTGSGYTNTPWRIDHCTFSGSGTLIDAGNGPGLIDHCNFKNLAAAQETIHIWGWYPDNTTGWTTSHAPGSPDALYLEDNTFTGAQGNSTCAFQAYYGARTVARYNTLNGAMLEQHGTAGSIGARWWEFYKNTFNNNTIMCTRAGSGVIFGNSGDSSLIMVEEDSGYPADYQIGRGQNEASYPAYVWGNSSSPSLNSIGCAPPAANMVQLNRDVYQPSSGTSLPATCTVGQGYWKTDEGGNWDTTHGGANDGMLYKCTATDTWTAYYTPYTYPHPLQGGTASPSTSPTPSPTPSPSPDTTSPSVPANLTASAASASQINLSWSQSTDNVGVTGYKVYRNGSQIATVTGASYQNTGLTASTLYSYTVSAYDAAGNNSGQSTSASATTQAGSASTPTPKPTPTPASTSTPTPIPNASPTPTPIPGSCIDPAFSPWPAGWSHPCPVFGISSQSVSKSSGNLTLSIIPPQSQASYAYKTVYISDDAWNCTGKQGIWCPITLSGTADQYAPAYIQKNTGASSALPQTTLQNLSLGTHYLAAWDWIWDANTLCYKGPGLNTCNTGQWRLQALNVY